MDDRRIDLSALDPARDARRFEHMVQSVLAASGPPARHPVAAALVARGGVAVAAALVVAAAAWAPVLLSRRATPSGTRSPDPVALVAAWAEEGAIPASADVFHVLGAEDER